MSLATAAPIIERPPPPLPRPWTGARIAGNLLLGLWILAGLGMVWFLVGSWDPDFFAKYIPWYASGLLTTIILVVISHLARRGTFHTGRLCAHVEEQVPPGHRLRLRLFLPRHAAARAGLPRLLRLRRLQG